VRHAGGGQNQVARTSADRTLPDDEIGLSAHDYIEFVGAGVRVNRLGLAGLETVQPHEQALGAKAVDLGHLVGLEDRVIGQVHRRFPTE
jgi:hypothetical protein